MMGHYTTWAPTSDDYPDGHLTVSKRIAGVGPKGYITSIRTFGRYRSMGSVRAVPAVVVASAGGERNVYAVGDATGCSIS